MRNSMRRLSGTPSLRGHHGLDLDRALGGADDAGKLGHDAVAGGVDDPPAVPADQGQDHALVGFEVAHGGGLVLVHEPAVARDVGGKNGGEPTLYGGLFVHDAFSALAEASGGSVAHRLADREDTALLRGLFTWADDVRLVLDTVGSERAAIMAWFDGGPMAMLFGATYPESSRPRPHGGRRRSQAPGRCCP